MHLRFALAVMALTIVLTRALPIPVLDEEVYLSIAHQAPALHPYDWWRAGPPWGGTHVANAFVFAHPPGFWELLQGGEHFTGDLHLLRFALGLPPALLLASCVGSLALGLGRKAAGAAALWLSAPITLMALQRGLMPDAWVAALSTLAVLLWLGAWRAEGLDRRRLAGAGLALAAGVWIKYPAAVVGLAMALDAARRGRLRQTGCFWLAFLGPWALGEAWLAATYGQIHLLTVLARAGEIPRGPISGRLLGALVRSCFGICPLLVLAPAWRRAIPLGVLLGGGALLWAWPADLTPTQRAILFACAAAGGSVLAAAAGLAWDLWRGRGRPSAEREDAFLLSTWAILAFGAVVLAHNYAAPRYLLPTVVPLALLLGRGLSRAWVLPAVAAQAALALLLSNAEVSLAQAADNVAQAAIAAYPEGGHFSGEWGLRWRMEQAGWTLYTGEAAPGSVVLLAPNAGSGATRPPEWKEIGHFSAGRGALRLVDADEGVGFYAETLGPLPLSWRPGRLLEATAWQVP